MPVVRYSMSEVEKIVGNDAEAALFESSLNECKHGMVKNVQIMHFDKEGKESYSSDDFNHYKSYIKVTFSERT